MDDVFSRALVIAVALVAAGVTMLILHHLSRRPRNIQTDLADGVHFFSSTACSSCETARVSLVEGLGDTGFAEYRWDVHQELFETLGVTSVPAYMVVRSAKGVLYFGDPAAMLAAL